MMIWRRLNGDKKATFASEFDRETAGNANSVGERKGVFKISDLSVGAGRICKKGIRAKKISENLALDRQEFSLNGCSDKDILVYG